MTCGNAFQECNRPFQDLVDIVVTGWQHELVEPQRSALFAWAAADPFVAAAKRAGPATMRLTAPLACNAA